MINTSLPCSISTPVLLAVSIILLISYNWFVTVVKPATFWVVIWFKFVSILLTSKLPTITCSPLFKILNESPTFKFDLSIGVFSVNVEPSTSTWNLELVLYFHELANISL